MSESGGCPVTVWDGPYSHRCALGAGHPANETCPGCPHADPERVTLTEGERAALTWVTPVDNDDADVFAAVERILSDRLRAAQADAWDEGWRACCSFSGRTWEHVEGWTDRNPYRGDGSETP